MGAPLYNIALLRYAECLAKVPNKRVLKYRMPALREGNRVWVDIEEYDTRWGIVDWPGEDYNELIVQEYLLSGKGESRKIGSAWSYLFDANDLVNFAVQWMDRNFNYSLTRH
jgi:aminoglycoside 3-N-acetyltransferase